MSHRRWHLAILRSAALLIPRKQRAEWLEEWRAELWYVRSNPTSFCLGAFRDAFWLLRHAPHSLRLESPIHCVALLAVLAATSLTISLPLPVEHDPPGMEKLVMVLRGGYRGATIRLEEYFAWDNDHQRLFTSLAFYQPMRQRVPMGPHGDVDLSIGRASDSLLQVLNVEMPLAHPSALVLMPAAWREYFGADPRIVGRTVEISGRQVMVSGIMPEDSFRLPGKVDAWLIEDRQTLATLPSESKGFVVAQLRKPSIKRMAVANDSGEQEHFDCMALAGRRNHPFAIFLLVLTMSGLILPVTTSLRLGYYPHNSGAWRWVFLASKLILIQLMVYSAVRWVAYKGGADPGILLGSILALRWAIVDQRQRCPVCLRLVKNPVRVGRPSQTFLEWYGTEFMCTKGHGLLHVPEIPTSCYSTQQWLRLDRSWSSLF